MKTVSYGFDFDIQAECWDWQFASHLLPYVYLWSAKVPKNKCASDIFIMNREMIIFYPVMDIS